MKPEDINVYSKLASIPHDIADKITNAKTEGGRCLNAIHDSKLSSSEKHLLLFLGSQLSYGKDKDFANQYRFISLNKIAEKMSITKQSVSNLLNGYKTKNKIVIGLIEKGYINKRKATIEEQIKGWSNHYCLSSKIFDEYILSMIEEYKAKNPKPTPSQIILPPQSNHLTPPSQIILHIVPSIQVPSLSSLNAVAQQQSPAAEKSNGSVNTKQPSPHMVCHPQSTLLTSPNETISTAAVKPPRVKKPTWKPSKKTKMKTWGEKTDDEKLSVIDDLVKDLHREAVEGRKAQPFNFDNIPDLLLPVIERHGLENVKIFLEGRRDEKRGCNVRFIEQEILKWVDDGREDTSDKKLDEKESNLSSNKSQENPQENSFPEKIIEQIEVNMIFDDKIDDKRKEYSEILNNLPIEFQEWINKLTKKHQFLLAKDLKAMDEKTKNAYLRHILEKEKKLNNYSILSL